MRRFSIKFSQTEEVARFVRILNRYDVEASVKCGSRTVDRQVVYGRAGPCKVKDSPADSSDGGGMSRAYGKSWRLLPRKGQRLGNS